MNLSYLIGGVMTPAYNGVWKPVSQIPIFLSNIRKKRGLSASLILFVLMLPVYQGRNALKSLKEIDKMADI